MNKVLQLLTKYDKAIPRYTSYPTVPYWENDSFSAQAWVDNVQHRFKSERNRVSVYIHLPYCEQLCTFCACNKRITKNHSVEKPYIDAVLQEWAMYVRQFGDTPVIKELHLGGGTPTFFSPAHLTLLIEGILSLATLDKEVEMSLEVHPNYTTFEHLEALAKLGFNRVSMGVQDFDPKVQFVINRQQTFEQTQQIALWAQALNYTSINIDLVYGLPHQSLDSIDLTINHVRQLKPHRIALYSYAHVPWKSKVQRRYTDDDLPKAELKWQMYQRSKTYLLETGYWAIGMDHFALPEDKLFEAHKARQLHRNFMGYTTSSSRLLIGLGVSSIGDAWSAFSQNEKDVDAYIKRINNNELPVHIGHILTDEDAQIRAYILNIMCYGGTDFMLHNTHPEWIQYINQELTILEQDGLVVYDKNKRVEVTELGQLFVRNVSAVFDKRLFDKKMSGQIFSQSI